jgi:hypothetical protein
MEFSAVPANLARWGFPKEILINNAHHPFLSCNAVDILFGTFVVADMMEYPG